MLKAGDTLIGPHGVPHAWEAIGADLRRVAAICADHGVRFA